VGDEYLIQVDYATHLKFGLYHPVTYRMASPPRTAPPSSAGTTPAPGRLTPVEATVEAPQWVKLVRSGNSFTGYLSPDGVSWTQLATESIPMPEVGLRRCRCEQPERAGAQHVNCRRGQDGGGQNTDKWAKGGVMNRESLAANATHALMAITVGNGAAWVATGGGSLHSAGPLCGGNVPGEAGAERR
jgi:hypothetical protein